jgi:hypothetical protein
MAVETGPKDQPVVAPGPRWVALGNWLRVKWPAWQVHLLVIALYGLAMVAFTWPLALHITDQSLRGYDYVIQGVPFDRDQFIWDMWWVKKALFDFHQLNPYHTSYLYYPYGVDLYLQSLTPVNGLLGTFFYGWLNGWLGAYNAVCLIIFVWCGHSAFLLADYLVRDKLCAFVAGFFFTLAPQHYFNFHHAQLNVITLQFFPLFLLYMLKLDDLGVGGKIEDQRSKIKDRRSKINLQSTIYNPRWWRYTLLAALFLVLCTISDQYLLLFGLIIMGLYYLWRGIPWLLKKNWGALGLMLARTVPAMALAGIVMLPYLYATWRTINSGQWAKISNDAVPLDLSTLIMPPVSNIFIGAQGSDWGRSFFIQPEPRSYSIGLVGLAIAIYGIIRCKEARWWGLLLGVSVVLALGSEVRWYNQSTGIPMPGKWLNELPVFEVMRYSKRWIGPASLAIAVASAYALRFHMARFKVSSENKLRWKRLGLAVAALALFTFEVEPWPVPLSGDLAALPKAYANHVLPTTDHRAILELPFYQKYTAKANEMYWQTAHERPIVGGYISRIYNFDYNDTPLAYFVDGYRPDQPDFLQPDPAGLRSLLAYDDFGYIAIYKFKLDPSQVERWRTTISAILQPGAKPYYEDDQVIFYQLPERAAGLTPAHPALVRGSSWSAAEKRPDGTLYRWILGSQATLPLFAPPGAATSYKIQFQSASYFRDRTVNVLLNGQVLTQLKVTPALQPYQFEIPASRLKSGDNLITLDPQEPPDRPSDHEKTQDTRPLTMLVSNLTFTAG